MNYRSLLIDTYTHIPPLNALSGMSDAQAFERIPHSSHNVAELVEHLSYWQSWYLRRCLGEAVPIAQSAAEGWPSVEPGDWENIRSRFVTGLEQAVASGEQRTDMNARVEPPINFLLWPTTHCIRY